jgi:hypothetical protein
MRPSSRHKRTAGRDYLKFAVTHDVRLRATRRSLEEASDVLTGYGITKGPHPVQVEAFL